MTLSCYSKKIAAYVVTLTIALCVPVIGDRRFSDLVEPTSPVTVEVPQDSAANHAPILIDGNTQFNLMNGVTGGDGSWGNPYLIEGWIIDASNSDAILIGNSSVFVIIRNCVVVNGGTAHNGISLANVTNAVLANNTAFNDKNGIYLNALSNNNTIFNNSVTFNTQYGICLDSASNNTLWNNTVSSNNYAGISLVLLSNFNNVTNNSVSGSGIYLYQSFNNSLTSNSLATCNIFLYCSNNNTLGYNQIKNSSISLLYSFNNHIDTSNEVNDKSVRYFENQDGIVLSGVSDVGQVIMVNCTNFVLNSLSIDNTGIGIFLDYSSNNTLANNSFTNDMYPIQLLDYSENNTIYNNSILNCDWGIYVHSNNNMLKGNTLLNCSQFGIDLEYCLNNSLQGNIMNDTGLMVYNSYNNTIDTSNKVNGKSVRYFDSQNGIVLSGVSDVGQVILVKCNNSLISDLTISNTVSGILLDASNNNIISNNILMQNEIGIRVEDSSNDNSFSGNFLHANIYQGLYFDQCSNNTIRNNTIEFNENGVYLDWDSNQNTLSSNVITNNRATGIKLASSNDNTITRNIINGNQIGIFITWSTSNNLIYLNTIKNSTTSNACDNGTSNHWDNGSVGNFWGDYRTRYPNAKQNDSVWDTPYAINGTAGTFDWYPLVNDPNSPDNPPFPWWLMALIVISAAAAIVIAVLVVRKKKGDKSTLKSKKVQVGEILAGVKTLIADGKYAEAAAILTDVDSLLGDPSLAGEQEEVQKLRNILHGKM